ncbi:MAG: hypothetical protein CL920_28575 [Deltaproteobacteria bacterium]|nr:hypothetical protein [Deltaproteobacteria bacterium]|tara:strand:- start:11772 stop:12752 length:981 start_codon:yes stop_codon:yes gene_type:complete
MSRAEQIPRQWRILKRLEAHHFGLSASDLAEVEGCPVRTIYRDIADLEEAGFPLIQEKRGKRSLWKLAFHRGSPQVPFTYSEIYALCLGRGLMRLLEGTDFYDSICSAFEKIRSTLPPGVLEHLEAFESNVIVRTGTSQNFSLFSDLIHQINGAIDENSRIEILYFSPGNNAEIKRKVDPYRLWIQDGAMYLTGYCHLRDGIRTFNLARIRRLDKLEESFEEVPDFDIDAYLADGFRTMTGEVMEIELLFDPQVKHVASEKIWHPTQEVIENEDGSVVLRFQAGGMKEIKTWILGFGPKIQVLKPEKLREAVANDIKKTYERYFPS